MAEQEQVPQALESWMVDYENEDGDPQHAVLSWLTPGPTKALPEVGTELVRLSDHLAALKAEREQLLREVREALKDFGSVEGLAITMFEQHPVRKSWGALDSDARGSWRREARSAIDDLLTTLTIQPQQPPAECDVCEGHGGSGGIADDVDCPNCNGTGRQPQHVDEQVKALARFFAGAVDSDFPEGQGLDSDGSPVSEAADIADLLADGDRSGALNLLADPGINDAHDALRAALSQPQQVDEEACERCGGDGSFHYPWDAGCKGKHEAAAQVDEAESSEGEKCAECGRTGCPWHIPDVDALARAACEIPAFDDIGVRDWSELLLAMPEWELRPTTGKAPEASTEQKEER